jgi:predicted MFS family arabinose efflux permease
MIFVGQCIGSFFASPVLQRINAKYVLIFALAVDIVTLWGFCMFESYWMLAILRIFTGMMQVMFTIYLPVWADSFGTEQEKPTWFALLIISNPLGTVLGYAVAALV